MGASSPWVIIGSLGHKELPSHISDLYQFAIDKSPELRKQIVISNDPYRNWIQLLTNGNDSLQIKSLSECQVYLEKIEGHISEKTRLIDPYKGLPLLLQAVTDHYFLDNNIHANWIGTSLKTALALTWKNVNTPSEYSVEMISTLADLTIAISLKQIVHAYSEMYKHFDSDWVEINSDGSSVTGKRLEHAKSQILSTYGQRGFDLYRTVRDSVEVIWERLDDTFNAIGEIVLGGTQPKDLDVFKKTIFAEFGKNEAPEFWIRLFCLLQLSILTETISRRDTQRENTIAIFEKIPFTVRGSRQVVISGTEMQNIIYRLFWKPDWYETSIHQEPHNMIVERGALRIVPTSEPDLFIASPSSMLDSINQFVESSIMGTRHHQRDIIIPYDLASRLQTIIATRFEKQVIDLFLSEKYWAGEVTNKGAWMLAGAHPLSIQHKTQPCPGQIDVLAYHPETGILYVIECKVLKIPESSSGIRNVMQTLNEMGAKGFHKNLKRKIEWLKKSNLIEWLEKQELRLENVFGLIVIDRMLLGVPDSKTWGDSVMPVVDFRALEFIMKANKGNQPQ